MQKTSNQFVSGSEKIPVASVRSCILNELKKEYPNITEKDSISVDELNVYRQRYIESVLENDLGNLTQVEKDVMQHMQDNELISNHLLDEHTESNSFGQKLADKVAAFGGSWTFIIFFLFFILVWMLINIWVLATKSFDPYPFILLNLILSCIAALQAPVIMMSQNRQEEKDRQRARNDYKVNLKSEMEIRMLHEKVDHLIINQQQKLMEVQQVQIDMLNDIIKKLNS